MSPEIRQPALMSDKSEKSVTIIASQDFVRRPEFEVIGNRTSLRNVVFSDVLIRNGRRVPSAVPSGPGEPAPKPSQGTVGSRVNGEGRRLTAPSVRLLRRQSKEVSPRFDLQPLEVNTPLRCRVFCLVGIRNISL
jgi:hypothetical protein